MVGQRNALVILEKRAKYCARPTAVITIFGGDTVVVTLFGSAPGSDDVISLDPRTLYYSASVYCVFRSPVTALVSGVYCRLQARAEYLVGNIFYLSVIFPIISHL